MKYLDFQEQLKILKHSDFDFIPNNFSFLRGKAGIYAISIDKESIVDSLEKHIIINNHSIIYIGMSTNLSDRLKKELIPTERSNGSFYRSLGSYLNFRIDKKKLSKFYRFSDIDHVKIINFAKENLKYKHFEIDDLPNEENLKKKYIKKNYEEPLIKEFKPPFNYENNYSNKFKILEYQHKINREEHKYWKINEN